MFSQTPRHHHFIRLQRRLDYNLRNNKRDSLHNKHRQRQNEYRWQVFEADFQARWPGSSSWHSLERQHRHFLWYWSVIIGTDDNKLIIYDLETLQITSTVEIKQTIISHSFDGRGDRSLVCYENSNLILFTDYLAPAHRRFSHLEVVLG